MIDLDPLPPADPRGFPLHAALAAAAACKAAYAPVPHSNTTRVLYRNDSADLTWCGHAKHLIIAVRGSDDRADWWSNLDASHIPLITGSGNTGLRVHRGFYESSLGLARNIFNAAAQITDRDFPRKVTLTGHSRGAGIVPHVAMQLGFPGFPCVQSFLFGAPRTGNRAWAAEYDAAFPDTWRVVNCGDLVTRLPRPWMSYWHVGRFAYIDRRRKVHTAATGYPRITADRLFASLNDIGRPGVASIRAHYIDAYMAALGAAT